VPVLISRDDSYFQDQYQAIPSKGYTEMMNNIIKNANLDIKLKTDYKNLE
jgi:UDP-galactopyranose mutase